MSILYIRLTTGLVCRFKTKIAFPLELSSRRRVVKAAATQGMVLLATSPVLTACSPSSGAAEPLVTRVASGDSKHDVFFVGELKCIRV